MYAIPSGYVYELDSYKDWHDAHDEKWDTVVYSATGKEVYQGSRFIDGSRHAVFLCQDGRYRAAMAFCCKPLLASEVGNHPPG